MSAFISNIQVFIGAKNSTELLEEVVLAISDRIIGAEYEETDDADSANRSLIINVSSDRWISVYDQKLDEQDINDLDELSLAISARAGVPAVGSIIHDSDLLIMRLYKSGKTADTMINNLELFNAMSAGNRPRKRNGQPSKWSGVCAPGVSATALKAVWEQDTVFADEAMLLAAELLAIPVEAAMRGFEVEPDSGEGMHQEAQARVLHFRSRMGISDVFQRIDVPKLAFTFGHSFASGDVGIPSMLTFGLTNYGQAFTGLNVLIWGPALEERLIELESLGIVFSASNETDTEGEWSGELQPFQFAMVQRETGQRIQINGYKYEFSEVFFPQGYMQVLYPETPAEHSIFNKWKEKLQLPNGLFQLTFRGIGKGKSNFNIAFVPGQTLEGQLGMNLPVYIGVEPDRELDF
ncbi:hypothetical protein KIH86_14220 [Paenibacillus sp. HN-1]|uniref:hypothetical protein n=1 Tax=Paenibacillus TaxID=44249 RepID=UPI001CA7BA06|nr:MULTISPECIES: hypothetical protein [Paenibacillus]MBY9080672.1 hypothetical protein [Paenibacillus sp. CGMCC 1.18879]MBY9085383.1 hypothetical protein [Paenibacillus sinensis]